jgi:hypothetical protein
VREPTYSFPFVVWGGLINDGKEGKRDIHHRRRTTNIDNE